MLLWLTILRLNQSKMFNFSPCYTFNTLHIVVDTLFGGQNPELFDCKTLPASLLPFFRMDVSLDSKYSNKKKE